MTTSNCVKLKNNPLSSYHEGFGQAGICIWQLWNYATDIWYAMCHLNLRGTRHEPRKNKFQRDQPPVFFPSLAHHRDVTFVTHIHTIGIVVQLKLGGTCCTTRSTRARSRETPWAEAGTAAAGLQAEAGTWPSAAVAAAGGRGSGRRAPSQPARSRRSRARSRTTWGHRDSCSRARRRGG